MPDAAHPSDEVHDSGNLIAFLVRPGTSIPPETNLLPHLTSFVGRERELSEVREMMAGGTTAASRNVVSGNGGIGVDLIGASGTKILGNRVGTTASGTAAGSNTIAFNGKDGVTLFSSANTGNEVSHNSVFSNAGLGIDLIGPGENFLTNLPTPNDAGDTDSGANNLQNNPALSSAKTVSGKTTIKGTLASTAGETFTIEFFSNPSGDEGKKFLGQKSVTTDGSGNASFTFTPATAVSVGQTVTATATSDSTHDTSEFSAPRKVASS